MVRHSFKTGLSFGLTSGIITTLGLMVGLHSFSGSRLVILGGILTIAIADAFSDALGIHLSEESEKVHSGKEIWESTASTFLSKFIFAITFTIPVLLFDLQSAISLSVILGLSALAILSYYIAREQETKTWKVVAEHLIIAIIVVITTHYIGDLIASTFG